jgi:hypothetical protein
MGIVGDKVCVSKISAAKRQPSEGSFAVMQRLRARRKAGQTIPMVEQRHVDERIMRELTRSPLLRDPLADDGWRDGCTADDFGRG